MTQDDKIAAIARYHAPEAKAQSMVYSVWEDGEITIEKGGSLFGQRNLHCVAPGHGCKAWDKNLFPMQNVLHGRILVATNKDAEAFRALIFATP